MRETKIVMGEKDHDSKSKSLAKDEEIFFESDSHVSYASANYLQQLKIWHGTFTNVNLLKLFLRPLPFLLSPVVSISITFFTAGTNKPYTVLVCIFDVRNANSLAQYVVHAFITRSTDEYQRPLTHLLLYDLYY
jgi:hypothetical protein